MQWQYWISCLLAGILGYQFHSALGSYFPSSSVCWCSACERLSCCPLHPLPRSNPGGIPAYSNSASVCLLGRLSLFLCILCFIFMFEFCQEHSVLLDWTQVRVSVASMKASCHLSLVSCILWCLKTQSHQNIIAQITEKDSKEAKLWKPLRETDTLYKCRERILSGFCKSEARKQDVR